MKTNIVNGNDTKTPTPTIETSSAVVTEEVDGGADDVQLIRTWLMMP